MKITTLFRVLIPGECLRHYIGFLRWGLFSYGDAETAISVVAFMHIILLPFAHLSTGGVFPTYLLRRIVLKQLFGCLDTLNSVKEDRRQLRRIR